MGKQYKKLTNDDIEFIKKQKLFYLASSSDNEVNLSPKGYDSIRVLDEKSLVYMSYFGSGNRTHRDALNSGEFTLLFNAFDGKPKILRLFCKATIIELDDEKFSKYVKDFGVITSQIRNFFEFNIYAVESSCGEAIPYMEYKQERKSLKNWVKKMDESGKLCEYAEKHLVPVDLSKV